MCTHSSSFDRLVKPVGRSVCQTSIDRKFINDDHFTVFYNVDVTLKNRMGLQRLSHMVQSVNLPRIVEIVHTNKRSTLATPVSVKVTE